MNKKFEEALTAYGMQINGNLAYGNVKGYETNVRINNLDNVAPFLMHISFFATEEQKAKIESEFKQAGLRFFRYSFTYYGITIGLNDITAGKLIQKLPNILVFIFNTIRANEVSGVGYCPVCGKELDMTNQKNIKVDDFTITVDEDCLNNINKNIEQENADFKNAPNNYLKGFLGALVGGVAGFAVAFILYLCGFISAISAFVAFAVGTALYKKFGGKANKIMVVIVSVTSLVFMILSVFAVYIYAAGSAASELGVTMGAFEVFAKCMTDAKFSGMFYTDLALTIVFSIVGIVWELITVAKQIKRPKKLQ